MLVANRPFHAEVRHNSPHLCDHRASWLCVLATRKVHPEHPLDSTDLLHWSMHYPLGHVLWDQSPASDDG